MVESREDQNVGNFHIEEPDLIDQRPAGEEHGPEASGDVGRPAGGPEVPDREGPTEAIGGLGVPEETSGASGDGPPESGNSRSGAGGESQKAGIPGGPASGTGQNAELSEKDIPDETDAEMPPGRKFGTPGITDGT